MHLFYLYCARKSQTKLDNEEAKLPFDQTFSDSTNILSNSSCNTVFSVFLKNQVARSQIFCKAQTCTRSLKNYCESLGTAKQFFAKKTKLQS